MSVELRPLGIKCNIMCQYCYQNPMRDAGNVANHYDMKLMKSAIEEINEPFVLFGGEPLLMPMDDLEELLAYGLQKFGRNACQTNGTLLTDEHISLFRKYRVQVGVSADGPGEMNDTRWAGSLKKTRELSHKTHQAIDKLCQAGIHPSVIITLHQGNGSAEKLPVLAEWIHYLDDLGIEKVRLHILEVDSEENRRLFAMSQQENVAAYLFFSELESTLKNIRFDVFDDMRRMLVGDDDQTGCVWNTCDPYTTMAVQGVEGFGQQSNCGRTNKDGIDFIKSGTPGYERQLALYQTPQEHNGCQGCRFFMMCKGNCPGTGISGDWRNRSEYCDVWKALFTHFEQQLLDQGTQPLSLAANRQAIEQTLLASWEQGFPESVASAIKRTRVSSCKL
jgi:uncharacterized protein